MHLVDDLKIFKLHRLKSLRLKKINQDENGVKIKDNTLGRVADIYFKPSGILCDLDKTDDCRHIDFALSLPSVQKIIRARRKEGWKLPDV